MLCAAVSAALFVFLLGRTLAAEPVTLTFSDGSFSVTGDIVSFDGTNYEIQTDLGVLTMASATTLCEGQFCPTSADQAPVVHISGAAALGDVLVPSLIESFAADRGYTVTAIPDGQVIVIKFYQVDVADPIAEFRLTLSSTAEGIADMLFGKSQFVMARRALTAGEKLAIESRFSGANGDPVRSLVMGWEHLKLYRHKDNPIEQLSISELISMIEKLPAFWPNADGIGLPVVLQGDFDSVSALRQQLGIVGATPLLNSSVNNLPGVLRVTSHQTKDLVPVDVVATCGVSQNDSQIPQDKYPLTSPLHLFASPTNLPPIARDFWAYMLSPRAQNVVSDLGYTSRTPTEATLYTDNSILLHSILNMDDEMRASDLRSAVQNLYGHSRLSLTFRFEDGTEVLNEQSETNLRFLARLLTQADYKNRDVIFAGFSDSKGSAEGNLQISKNRARAVRATIRNLMGDQRSEDQEFRALGFGEAMPLACNDTDWGQNQNRRVEIWMR